MTYIQLTPLAYLFLQQSKSTDPPTDVAEDAGLEPTDAPTDVAENAGMEPTDAPTDVAEDAGMEPTGSPTDVVEENAAEPTAGPTDVTEENAAEPTAGPTDVAEGETLVSDPPVAAPTVVEDASGPSWSSKCNCKVQLASRFDLCRPVFIYL